MQGVETQAWPDVPAGCPPSHEPVPGLRDAPARHPKQPGRTNTLALRISDQSRLPKCMTVTWCPTWTWRSSAQYAAICRTRRLRSDSRASKRAAARTRQRGSCGPSTQSTGRPTSLMACPHVRPRSLYRVMASRCLPRSTRRSSASIIMLSTDMAPISAGSGCRLRDAVAAIEDYTDGARTDRKNELRLAATVQLVLGAHRIRMLGHGCP